MRISDSAIHHGIPRFADSGLTACLCCIKDPGVIVSMRFSVDQPNDFFRCGVLRHPVTEGLSVNLKVHCFIIKTVLERYDSDNLFCVSPSVCVYQTEDELNVVAETVNLLFCPFCAEELCCFLTQYRQFVPLHYVAHSAPPVPALPLLLLPVL